MELKEILEKVEDIEWLSDFWELYNLTVNDVNGAEELFEDYIDIDVLEDWTMHELKEYGVERLQYFLPERISYEDVFRVDGYGNIQNVDSSDLDYVKEELIKLIKEQMEDESEEEE